MHTIDLWGIRVDAYSPESVISWIQESSGHKRMLLNHNLHSTYLHLTNEHFRALYSQSDLTLVDGMPILAALSLRRLKAGQAPYGPSRRCGSTDWIPLVGQMGAGTRIAVIGANASSNTRAVQAIGRLAAGCTVRGWCGYGGKDELIAENFDSLKQFQPDLVLLGLGMPVQEQFLLDHWDELPTAVFATIGGAIDQLSGEQSLAPRWTGKLGVEWLWRLASDPRRLGSRYLIEPFKLLRVTLAFQRERRANR
ncbi:N-acetylglucosaminyldiphosphoundecaprenol N-acetyl-beta-D-mannosaminyltransferase [Rhodococcus sp. 27YEA15]|uniref:WecB/TagA/CpsF family glycosyltransferase n=1 Tax=Rhodococcus sp. 27YEA15 TaxID=3156259 RepID=UPI003C7A5323